MTNVEGIWSTTWRIRHSSFVIRHFLHEHRDRMRRNGRTSVSWSRGCGSSARPRSRGDALHFRKRDRRAWRSPAGPNSDSINCRRLPSPFSPAILGFLRRFNESLSLCRGIYRKFKPHVVLGMGGFTSTAPVLAGKMRGIPTFIHESNAIPGKANRLTARMVRAVLLGFKECAPFFPRVRTEVTGTPRFATNCNESIESRAAETAGGCAMIC